MRAVDTISCFLSYDPYEDAFMLRREPLFRAELSVPTFRIWPSSRTTPSTAIKEDLWNNLLSP